MADRVESLAELFLSRLKTTSNAGVTLAQFYGSLFNIECGRSEIISINRLIKVFGRSFVFFAILDIAKKGTFEEFPFGLLYKICKDKVFATVQADTSLATLSNLDRMIADIEKDMAGTKKIDVEKAGKYLEDNKKEG